jgi:hypothetical protein
MQEHLNPFFVRRTTITTPFTVNECVEHLRADLAPWYVFWGVTQGMKGRADENGFAVSRFTGARKSLPSQARGRFSPEGRGTRLDVEIGWRRVDVIGLTLATLFVLAVVLLVGRENPREGWLPFVFVPLMAVASVIHRLATYHDDEWLVTRLCEKLQGVEAPAALN